MSPGGGGALTVLWLGTGEKWWWQVGSSTGSHCTQAGSSWPATRRCCCCSMLWKLIASTGDVMGQGIPMYVGAVLISAGIYREMTSSHLCLPGGAVD